MFIYTETLSIIPLIASFKSGSIAKIMLCKVQNSIHKEAKSVRKLGNYFIKYSWDTNSLKIIFWVTDVINSYFTVPLRMKQFQEAKTFTGCENTFLESRRKIFAQGIFCKMSYLEFSKQLKKSLNGQRIECYWFTSAQFGIRLFLIMLKHLRMFPKFRFLD